MSVTDPDVEEINHQLTRVAEACLDGRPVHVTTTYQRVFDDAQYVISDLSLLGQALYMAARPELAPDGRTLTPDAIDSLCARFSGKRDELNNLMQPLTHPDELQYVGQRPGRNAADPPVSEAERALLDQTGTVRTIHGLTERILRERDAERRAQLVRELKHQANRLAPGTTRKGMSFAVHFHMPTVLETYDALVPILTRRNQNGPVLADVWGADITIGPVAGRTRPTQAACQLIATEAKRVRRDTCGWHTVRAAERAARTV